ncbi:hypothetical protein TNCV_3100781 [Trichonephila clavipes]|nr:hypothetical protein TNCV_3100781 [Trichonephila clavipes]
MYDVTIDDSFFNLNQSTSQVPQEEINKNITIEESLIQPSNRRCYRMKRNNFESPLEKRMYQEACYLMNMLRSSLSQQFTWVILETSGRELDRVTPFMIATSELRCVDRRGVTPQHLLYMAMKIMRLRE